MVAERVHSAFPWGTLTVNVVGSCLIGAIFGLLEPTSRFVVSNETRAVVNQFFMVGVLGGFTTFSAFSLQTLSLLREQQWWLAGANVLVSVTACLVAVALGYYVVYCCVTR